MLRACWTTTIKECLSLKILDPLEGQSTLFFLLEKWDNQLIYTAQSTRQNPNKSGPLILVTAIPVAPSVDLDPSVTPPHHFRNQPRESTPLHLPASLPHHRAPAFSTPKPRESHHASASLTRQHNLTPFVAPRELHPLLRT